MLTYDVKSNTFQFNQNTCKDYIAQKLERSKLWNETQLTLIIDTMVNFLDTVLEVFKNRLGSGIQVFQSLAKIVDQKQDVDKVFLKKMIEWRKSTAWVGLDKIGYNIAKPYQICLGDLSRLTLERLQERKYITQEQKEDAQAIATQLLDRAIKQIQDSDIYKAASKEGNLYFDDSTIAQTRLGKFSFN